MVSAAYKATGLHVVVKPVDYLPCRVKFQQQLATVPDLIYCVAVYGFGVAQTVGTVGVAGSHALAGYVG